MDTGYRRAWFSLILMCVLALIVLIATRPTQGSGFPQMAMPHDWSHHHLVFSAPANFTQAWMLQQQPRYWHQWLRLNAAALHENQLTDGLKHHRDRPGPEILSRDWAEDMGSGTTVGAGMFPAKFSFNITTASCANDFVAFNTGVPGSSSQASIIAYSNLYSGCGSTVPSVFWAYNTGGTVQTSVSLSLDGSQLAFVQNSTGNQASLVLLKWHANPGNGTASSPITLTAVSNASYRSCTAPCMTTIAFSQSKPDSNSPPFYDFNSDTAFAGDDNGFLHKFTGAFNGTPAEVLSNGWPVTIGSQKLTGPVFDASSGIVFVADHGGVLSRVNGGTATGSLVSSSAIGQISGIAAPPILDTTAAKVYVFVPQLTSSSSNAGVVQFATTFVAGNSGSSQAVGSSSVGTTLYAGTFDNAYLSSTNGASPTGQLYVCGNPGGDPTLYQIPITNNVMGAATALPVLTGGSTPCSPVTEINNGARDWIFLSPQNMGSSSVCAGGGCVLSFAITAWQANHAYSLNNEVLDTNGNVQVVTTAGTSGGSAPAWNTTQAGNTADNNVTWRNQGALANTTTAWQSAHVYTLGNLILDTNNNIQRVTAVVGASGASQPTWNTTTGLTTSDGLLVTWTNQGPAPGFALPVAGGASAIIIDNTVGSGTLAGASQVYFSSLANRACTGGTGGCAMQASQAALQ